MNHFKLTFYCLLAAVISMLSSCKSKTTETFSDNTTICFLQYRSDTKDVTSQDELAKTAIPSIKLVYFGKGLSVRLSDIDYDESGNYFAFVEIYSWSGDGEHYYEKAISTGKTKKRGGDVEMYDWPEEQRYTVTYDLPSNDEIALIGTINPNAFFALVEDESSLEFAQSLIDKPQFAAVKEFIDNYTPTSRVIPISGSRESISQSDDSEKIIAEAEEEDNDNEVVKEPVAVEKEKKTEETGKAETTQEQKATTDGQKTFILTKTGIKGVVTLGMSIKSIPAKVDGLYDKVEMTKSFNEMEQLDVIDITFYLNGKDVMGGTAFDLKTLDKLYTEAKNVQVGVGANALRVGQKAKGVKFDPETGAYMKDGVYVNTDTNNIIINFLIGDIFD